MSKPLSPTAEAVTDAAAKLIHCFAVAALLMICVHALGFYAPYWPIFGLVMAVVWLDAIRKEG